MRASRLPTAALLAAAIVLAVELAGVPVARRFAWPALWHNSSPRTDDALRFTAQLELANPDEQLLYITGSSQGRENIDRGQVHTILTEAGVTNLEVWNLSVAGGDIIDAYLQLDAIAEKPPRLLVLVSSWVFFYDRYDPTKLELYCTSLTRLRQLAQIYGPLAFWRDVESELSSTVLSNLVPSFRWARNYLSTDLLGSMLRGKHTEPRWFAGYASHGEEYFLHTIARHRGRHSVTLDTIRKRRTFEAFVHELHARDIELVLAEGPVHPRSAENEADFRVIWEDYVTNMRRLSEELAFTYVEIDACGLTEPALFNDFGHLNESGRARFTECITRDGVLPHLMASPKENE